MWITRWFGKYFEVNVLTNKKIDQQLKQKSPLSRGSILSGSRFVVQVFIDWTPVVFIRTISKRAFCRIGYGFSKRTKEVDRYWIFCSGFLKDYGFGFQFWFFLDTERLICYQSTSATKVIAVQPANNRKLTLFFNYGFYLWHRRVTNAF